MPDVGVIMLVAMIVALVDITGSEESRSLSELCVSASMSLFGVALRKRSSFLLLR